MRFKRPLLPAVPRYSPMVWDIVGTSPRADHTERATSGTVAGSSGGTANEARLAVVIDVLDANSDQNRRDVKAITPAHRATAPV